MGLFYNKFSLVILLYHLYLKGLLYFALMMAVMVVVVLCYWRLYGL
jgi:hypothetical protein